MKWVIVSLFLSSASFAAEPVSAKASKTETAPAVVSGVVISVKGMVCSFCAQGIEKKLKAFKEVKSVEVDLDTKKVSVHFVLGQSVPIEKIQETIKNAGYEVTDVKNLGVQQ